MYVAGFVLSVKTAKKEDYRKMAQEAVKLFRDGGATRVVECWGDNVPDGTVTSFPMAVKREQDETVLFSWIEFPDKATHDACMAKMEADGPGDMSEMKAIMDPKRMIWGGFEVILDA